jgi:hypothetical protein
MVLWDDFSILVLGESASVVSSQTVFVARSVFSAFMLGLYTFWSLFSLLFSSVLRIEYVGILSLLSWAITVSILAKDPKTDNSSRNLR